MQKLRLRQFPWALAAVWLAACGARSTLYEAPSESETAGSAGTGGTGGSTTSNNTTDTTSITTSTTSSITTSTTTSTSTGTMNVGPCAGMGTSGSFATLAGGSMENQRSPRLSYSSPDGSQVTLGSAWSAAGGMNNPVELRHTTFSPWGSFPSGSSLGPTYLADLDAGGSFAIAPSDAGHFALLYRNFQVNPPNGLLFSPSFAPGSGDIPMSFAVDDEARTAAFLSRGASGGYGFGAIARQQNGEREIRAGLIDANQVVTEYALGCSQGATVEDGVAFKDSFIVAFGTGTAVLNSGCQNANPDTPNRLQVIQMAAGVMNAPTEVDQGPDLTDVRLAARPDGAWLVYNAGPSTLRVALLDPNGQPTGKSFDVSATYEPGSVAAASAGEVLMLAWSEGGLPHVQALGPDGSLQQAQTLKIQGQVQGRLSLIGAPNGVTQWVLAWSESTPDTDQIRLSGVECFAN